MENKALANIRENKSQLLMNLVGQEFRMNSIYPQTVAATIISFGSTFLTHLLERSITYTDIQLYNPSDQDLSSYVEKVSKLHAAYGQKPKVGYVVADIPKLRSLYFKTANEFWTVIEPFACKKNKQHLFFENPDNQNKFIQMKETFNAGFNILNSPKLLDKASEYRNSLRPVLEKGLRGVSGSEMRELRRIWSGFSIAFEQEVMDAMRSVYMKNGNDGDEKATQYSSFKNLMKKHFKVEAHQISKDWQYVD